MFQRAIKFIFVFIMPGLIFLSCRAKNGIAVVNNSEPKFGNQYVDLKYLYNIDVTQISLFNKTSNYDCEGKIDFDHNGNMYILDEYQSQVTVYDKNGRQVKKFGKPGQGPNDFDKPNRILLKGENVYIFFGGIGGEHKILDLDGNFLSHHTSFIENKLKIKPVGNEFYVMNGEVDRTFTNLEFVLTIRDETLSKKREVFRSKYKPGLRGPSYEFIWAKWMLISKDGGFYYPEDNFGDYSIINYDRRGNPRLKFQRPYKAAAYSAEAKDRFYSLNKKLIERNEIAFPTSPPVVVNMFQDGLDNIWVVSGETSEDNLNINYENAIDIFADSGKWLSSFRTKFISKNTLYHDGRIYRILPLYAENNVQIIEVYAINYLK